MLTRSFSFVTILKLEIIEIYETKTLRHTKSFLLRYVISMVFSFPFLYSLVGFATLFIKENPRDFFWINDFIWFIDWGFSLYSTPIYDIFMHKTQPAFHGYRFTTIYVHIICIHIEGVIFILVALQFSQLSSLVIWDVMISFSWSHSKSIFDFLIIRDGHEILLEI